MTVDIATDLRVPPSVVDVDDADHIPLKNTKNHIQKDDKTKKINDLHANIYKLNHFCLWAPFFESGSYSKLMCFVD